MASPSKITPVPLFVLLAAVLFSLLATGCGKSDDEEGAAELEFRIDPELVGPAFRDATTGFFIHPPLGWPAAPEQMLLDAGKRLDELAEEGEDIARLKILAIYSETDRAAHMAVGRYGGELDEAGADAFVQAQFDRIRAAYPESEFHPGRFTHNGYRIDQCMISGPGTVVVKLFAWRPETGLFQIDYVFSRAAYAANLKALESSIGSLGMSSP